ncbi:MAG TPA: hypothetical protein VFC53_13375 [Dehalococcoidia bacterium]|nr:hypothetical protein [Dehalococcoidia bacterium]
MRLAALGATVAAFAGTWAVVRNDPRAATTSADSGPAATSTAPATQRTAPGTSNSTGQAQPAPVRRAHTRTHVS